MTHTHPPDFYLEVVRAVLQGETIKLPDCCVDDLIQIAEEMLDDDRVLSSEFVQ